jgi:uncharacterized SAM-binding protein YcdF (DUF218 family)
MNILKTSAKLLIILTTILFFSSCFKQIYKNKQAKDYSKNIIYKPFDAIIVPGYPYNGKEWDAIIKMRVLWASYLYKNGIAKNIIFSGSSVYSPYVESIVMKQYAIKLGVDSTHIFTEEKAEHSTENVYYSLKIAKTLNFKNIALATDNFQTRLVKPFIKKHKLNIKILPINIAIIDSLDKANKSIKIADSIGFVKDFLPITKTQSFYYRWKGTRGKNIDFTK